MQSALRLETTILPGNRIEISAPELPEGARVEVIIVLPEQPKPRRMHGITGQRRALCYTQRGQN